MSTGTMSRTGRPLRRTREGADTGRRDEEDAMKYMLLMSDATTPGVPPVAEWAPENIQASGAAMGAIYGARDRSAARDVRARHGAVTAASRVARRHGNFDDAEDAVQEALLAAATQWPADGLPDNPAGWLVAVAERCPPRRSASRGCCRRRCRTNRRWPGCSP
jgi:hypothetical protein